jgi:hypothetical protein
MYFTGCLLSDDISVTVDRCHLNSLSFKDTNNVSLAIGHTTNELIVLEDCGFSMINFFGRLSVKEFVTYSVSGTECAKLIFKNLTLSEESKLHLTRFNFHVVELINFENKGSFEINNFAIHYHFLIKKCNLGNSVLNDFEIITQKFWILDSNIEGLKFLNFRWRNNYLLEEDTNLEGLNEYNFNFSLRESYRQLKTNYITNGNRIESLEFQKHELRVHYEVTKLSMIESIINSRRVWFNIGNFLILRTHKHVSDFSQNVWKPLLLIFFFHFLFYNLLIYSHDLGYFWTSTPDLSSSVDAVGNYFTTLLPTHRAELRHHVTNKTVDISGTTDFFMRVTTGYFLFYFITASIKYHQKE